MILEHEGVIVRELTFTDGLADELWEEMKKYSTLFNVMTEGNRQVVDALIFDPTVYWAGFYEKEELVAVAYTMLKTIHDASLHLLVFRGHSPADYTETFRQLLPWLFQNFNYHRLSIEVPVIYNQTITLAKKLGFHEEGRRRGVYPMRKTWHDEALFGLTREEVL